MATLEEAKMQLRQCLIASKNRRDLGNNDPDFPDTPRLTISPASFQSLHDFFLGLQDDHEFKDLYPRAGYRFTTHNVGEAQDLKISPIEEGTLGSAIFDYHILVQ